MSVNDTFFVFTRYGDPVKKSDVNLATYNGNVLYGYYGYGRNRPQPHRGYDYLTEERKTEIIAVGNGKVVKVRFGHPVGDNYPKDSCSHRKRIRDNSFESSLCSTCDYIGHCYGIQVWLKLDNTSYYAYYAHLNKLSENILDEIKGDEIKGDVIIDLEVKKGDLIGVSGRTGNVSGGSWPDHLHFECRTGNGEVGTDISPNIIVRTGFFFKNDQGEICDKMEKKDKQALDLKESIIKKLKEKEQDLLKKKERSIAEGIQLQSVQAQILWNEKAYDIFKIDQLHLK